MHSSETWNWKPRVTSSSVTAWPSKRLTGQLPWKMLKLLSEMGQGPIWWKELVPEAPHIQMKVRLCILWNANSKSSHGPNTAVAHVTPSKPLWRLLSGKEKNFNSKALTYWGQEKQVREKCVVQCISLERNASLLAPEGSPKLRSSGRSSDSLSLVQV